MLVFSAKIYIESQGWADYEENMDWIQDLDGCAVDTFFRNGDGMAGDYFIAHEWMIDHEDWTPFCS